ncbi:MAG: alanine--glyoxylate aminotransferase family protein [Chloroflexota bacterium]
MSQLRIPGPTPLPEEVMKAISRQMVDHRGPEFGKILLDVTAKLKQLFQTQSDILVLTGSGTGGLEAAVVNLLSPGDPILAVSIGAFGDRLINIAEKFGAKVIPLRFEWGLPADPEVIRKTLKDNPEVKVVFVTHNETSTGVTNDLEAISRVVKGAGKLLAVDGISSVGSIDLPADKWQCDMVVTASQKGWMVPPGLTMISVSPLAWQATTQAKMPRYYWDFTQAKKYGEKGQTPWTPAISVILGMQVALELMLKEGLANTFARQAKIGKACREGIKSLGLKLFAPESHASNTVTAVRADGLEVKRFRQLLREGHGVVIADGQGKLEGQIFRIGHLGLVTGKDIQEVLEAIKVVLPKAGFKK